jgi:ElaB/YqjD/DUF883 family membrane-anchored ribosome-binding protein
MAERVHRSSEGPAFTVYTGGRAVGDGNSALEENARRVGDALGRAVVSLREARSALVDIAQRAREVAAARITDLKSQAQRARAHIRVTAGDMGENVAQGTRRGSRLATSTASALRRATAERVRNLGENVKMGFERTRVRADQTVREYPVQVVLTAGAVGFLLGVGLRIWRSNRGE